MKVINKQPLNTGNTSIILYCNAGKCIPGCSWQIYFVVVILNLIQLAAYMLLGSRPYLLVFLGTFIQKNNAYKYQKSTPCLHRHENYNILKYLHKHFHFPSYSNARQWKSFEFCICPTMDDTRISHMHTGCSCGCVSASDSDVHGT